MKRVVVGMSGGVDSSVAAALLQRDGWEVIGVTLHLWDYVREGHEGRCCAPEDQYDAARVCARLDIAHYTFDRRALFREAVVDRFVDDYAAGRTPSPCVRCNESVKLGPLAEIADALGASHIASGHYARLPEVRPGRAALAAASMPRRTRATFSGRRRPRPWPARCCRWGRSPSPRCARSPGRSGCATPRSPTPPTSASSRGAPTPTSSRSACPPPPARWRTSTGACSGSTRACTRSPWGSARGVGAGGVPRYVLRIVPERGAVVVGDDGAVACAGRAPRGLSVAHVGAAAAGDARGCGTATPGSTRRSRSRARVATLRFAAPQRGVAPGQAAVLYDGDRVVGGGWIDEGLS